MHKTNGKRTSIIFNGEKKGMTKKLVMTVGNEMMGDDAAGPLLAQKLKLEPVEGWELLNGGSAPENFLHKVRELGPEHVLIIDATDMDLVPGEIRMLGKEKIQDPFLMTTHTLPLSYLMQSLSEFVTKVDFIGIQPEVVAFGYPVSKCVKQAVDRVYETLKQDEPVWELL
jgi:hydrogenase 3 maturation protease